MKLSQEETLNNAATIIQKRWRGFSTRKMFKKFKHKTKLTKELLNTEATYVRKEKKRNEKKRITKTNKK